MALPDSDARLLDALSFAIKLRKDRLLDAGSVSWVEHAIEVAELLSGLGLCDGDMLVAIALGAHLPGAPGKRTEIGRAFGLRVRTLVEELAPPRELNDDARLEWLLGRLPSSSRSARVIQLATAAVTLRHLPTTWGQAQRAQYFEWVAKVRLLLAGTSDRLDAHVGEALRRARLQPVAEPSRKSALLPTSSGPASTPGLQSAFIQDVRQVWLGLGRLEEQLGDVIASADGGPALVIPRGPDARPPKRPRKYADPKLKNAAVHGVGAIAFRVKGDDTVLVSIDNAPEFELSSALADLLEVISSGATFEPDGFLAFHPLDAVASALVARGRQAERHTVNVAIGRLRDELEKLHYPPLLVETLPGVGVRFRKRRPLG